MTERTVKLHNMGYWQDDVGSRFERLATDSVRNFNEASLALWQRIDTLAAYSIDDIQYESQRNKLESMRVEFNG